MTMILPEYARGPILTEHVEDGRYVTAIWSAICDRETSCEQCGDAFPDRGHPVRTYRDAGDVFDLCDECVRGTAAHCAIGGNDAPGEDPTPDADYLHWADFDTVEDDGHDGTGRGLY